MGLKKVFSSLFQGRADIKKDPEGFIDHVLKDMNEKVPVMRDLVSAIHGKKQMLSKLHEQIASKSHREQESIRQQMLDLEIAHNRAIEAMNRYIARGRDDIKLALSHMGNAGRNELMNRFNEIITRFEFLGEDDRKENNSQNKYERALAKAERLGSYAGLIANRRIAKKVLEAGKIAVDIINSFKEKYQPGYINSMFINYYLDAAVETVEGYLEIQEKTGENSSIRELVKKAEETIIMVHASFKKILANITLSKYQDFDIEMDLLRKTLDEIDIDSLG
jgi:hypothetical protein